MSKTGFRLGAAAVVLMAMARPVYAQEPARLAPSQLWIGGVGSGDRIPLAGDVDGDGRADVLAVSTGGSAQIEVWRTSHIGKPRFPRHARDKFGTGLLAAVCGHFTERDRADVVALFASGDVRVASSYQPGDDRYLSDTPVAKLPPEQRPKGPVTAIGCDIDGDGLPDVVLIDSTGRLTLLHNDSAPEGTPRFSLRPISGSIPRARRIAAGEFGATGRASLVWLDSAGVVYRADLRQERGQPAALGPAARVWMASADDGLAVGRFSGGKTSDILIGRFLLVGGSPRRAAPQPDVPTTEEAKGDAAWIAADFDGDGVDDLLRVRRSGERFVGDDARIHFARTNGRPAWNATALRDGLLDSWKAGKVKPGGLDLPALGCTIGHRDAIVEVQRIEDVPEAEVRAQVDRAVRYFASLPIDNPDKTRGIALHILYREPIPIADKDLPWPELAEKYHPATHRGITHWLVVYNGGGGQTTDMSDRGSCGVQALYATFLHEFGHQLGLDHTGHWGPSWCPIYPSLMNYAYNYQLNGSNDDIGYSDGRLASVVLNEKRLSERLPLPMEKVSFLAGPPYYYRLQPSEDGKGTLIDWNRNGIFGEADVAADINYGYATQAGPRHVVGKSYTAPVLAVCGGDTRPDGGKAPGAAGRSASNLLLFSGRLPASAPLPPANATARQPSLSSEQTGALRMRVWEGKYPQSEGDRWSSEIDVEPAGLAGDASAATLGGVVWVAYPFKLGSRTMTAAGGEPDYGVAVRRVTLDVAGRPVIGTRMVVPATGGARPTLAQIGDRLVLLLWRGADSPLSYRFLKVENERLILQPERSLDFVSAVPVGAASESESALWLGIARDFPGGLASRWQVRRFAVTSAGSLQETRSEWIGGDKGTERGIGRIVLLHEDNPAFGREGQLYFLGCGLYSEKAPWDCHYVVTRIADKETHGGWLTRRYYDEWTLSRSAPAACFFRGDIAFASRWFGDSPEYGNDDLFVGFFGKGIESEPMGDFDDIGFIRDIGLEHSLVFAGE